MFFPCLDEGILPLARIELQARASVSDSEERMADDASDESLMTLVAQGDQRAFRVLMGRNMGLAIRVAQRVVGNAAEADDIGQDAFLRVWKRARSFDPRIARFTTWLYRIVLNLVRDRWHG